MHGLVRRIDRRDVLIRNVDGRDRRIGPGAGRRATSPSWSRSPPAARRTSLHAWSPTNSASSSIAPSWSRTARRRRNHRRRHGRQGCADGHTILAYGALSTAQALYAKLPYDTLNDFIPITALGSRRRRSRPRHPRATRRCSDMIAAGQGETRHVELFVGRRRIGIALRRRTPAGRGWLHGPALPFKGSGEALREIVAGAWTSVSNRSRRPCRSFRTARCSPSR